MPVPRHGEVLLRVRACGVCRTDLHIVEGELSPHRAPLVPGHQIVGTVVARGPHVALDEGARVGVSWLGAVDERCRYCRACRENLCDHPTLATLFSLDRVHDALQALKDDAIDGAAVVEVHR